MSSDLEIQILHQEKQQASYNIKFDATNSK